MNNELIEFVCVHEDAHRQLPGVLAIKDVQKEKSYYAYCNQQSCDLIGYKSPSHAYGISDYDLNCDAVEQAGFFNEIDQQVVTIGCTIQSIDFYNYTSDNVIGVWGTKRPITNHLGKIIGLYFFATPLTKQHFSKLSQQIGFDSIPRGSHIIRDNLSEFGLTESESKIMFYCKRLFNYSVDRMGVAKIHEEHCLS